MIRPLLLACACLLPWLVGCDTPSIPTTSIAVRLISEEGKPIKDAKVVWNRRQGSRRIDGEGPFTTDKKGQVILPRAVTKSDYRDRYEIRFQHPSYHPGSAYFSTDGMLTVVHDDEARTISERPFLHGNYVIKLKRRSD